MTDSGPESKGAYPPALDEKFRLGMEYHHSYISSIASMDTKATALLAVAGVTLAVLASGKSGTAILNIPAISLGVLSAGILCFLLGAISIFRTTWVRGFKDGPTVRSLISDYWSADSESLKYNILYHACRWEEQNRRLLSSKERWLKLAMGFTSAEVVLLALWSVL